MAPRHRRRNVRFHVSRGGGGIIAADDTQGITSQNESSHTSGAADGGVVTVNTSNYATITTGGAGAAGIVAQRLSGGGIIQGLNGISPTHAAQYVGATSPASGGPVKVTLNSSIYTTGAYAPGPSRRAPAWARSATAMARVSSCPAGPGSPVVPAPTARFR